MSPDPTEDLWPPSRIAAIAKAHGTPVFAYDIREIIRRTRVVKDAFGGRVDLLYAVKANPLPALLSALQSEVHGLDVASLGEVRAAIACGFSASQLRLAGPGKTERLLNEAVDRGVAVSVESPEELDALAAIARKHRRRAGALLRLEPRTLRHTFAVQMGRPTHPFGLDPIETKAALDVAARNRDALDVFGVHVYGGTQCRSVRGWLGHLTEALDLAESVAEAGLSLKEINVGGGFGVSTPKGGELDVPAVGRRALPMLDKIDRDVRFVLELGRFLVSDAGVYITRVLRTKVRREHRTAVLDGGVHHLWTATGQLGPAPTAIGVRGETPVPQDDSNTHLMGPLCTPLDHLGTAQGTLRTEDLVAFRQTGAYGATLSPVNFLGHGPPKEVVLTADRPEPDETSSSRSRPRAPANPSPH